MADRQNGDETSTPSSRQSENTEENSANNNTSSSVYSSYLAWTQYWQYCYYTYSFYYYNVYYYYVLNQQGQTSHSESSLAFPGSLRQGSGPQNAPNIGQRILNGGVVRLVDNRQDNVRPEIYEYNVASLWRRICAELIDFVFLFFIKYMLFSLYYKDADQINSQLQYILIVDESTNLKDIEDVIIQALLYRLILFVYEAFFVAVPFPCSVGGATLGKYMMGITVISYQGLTPVQGHHLRRFSGSASRRLLPWQACLRAVFKNFMVTFFFPIMFTAMFLQNYRTPYDFMAKSIVVDAYPRRLRQN